MDSFENKREIKPEKYEIIELNDYSDFFTSWIVKLSAPL